MAKINSTPVVNNEFTPKAEPLEIFFNNTKRGFYIPLYQRPYSWSGDNIDQLMEDLFNGVENMLADEDVVTFLGTVILCTEKNSRANINPLDVRALPELIYNVIDGQQRISTLALLATRLYRRGYQLIESMDGDALEDLKTHLEGKMKSLRSIFSLESTSQADPIHKPVIVRGNQDEWTLTGDDTKYKSELSNYLAEFIRNMDQGGIDIPDKRKVMGKNLARIDEFIEKIFSAHTDTESSSNFPNGIRIVECVSEELIWQYERAQYIKILDDEAHEYRGVILEGIQFLLFLHYFLKRTCFSVIIPTSDNWAFDIFQSLNATGTPLTALETFKPLIVNWAQDNGGFKGSVTENHYFAVERLFEGVQTAAAKTKLTNEFLNVFRLIYEGKSMQSQFSEQRKWLYAKFQNNLVSAQDKEEFVHRMADLASYWKKVLEFDHNLNVSFHGLNDNISEDDRRLAVLCVKYLNDANHKMANTILSRFYSRVIRGAEGANNEFAKACRVVTAFFTLWRSAKSNSGLDDVYRSCLNGSEGNPNFSWMGPADDLTVDKLQQHFQATLAANNISTLDEWMNLSSRYMSYSNAKKVCKFSLFVTSHDCVLDDDNPGLMKQSAPGFSDYLNIMHWESSDLKTIEHVAPQTPSENSGWDENLYDVVEEGYNKLGNLTLLPVDINSIASNNSWDVKNLYYRHLAESDLEKRKALENEAADKGIDLDEGVLEKLCNSTYASHIQPIVGVSEAGGIYWNEELVDSRSERMLTILGERMFDWLNG